MRVEVLSDAAVSPNLRNRDGSACAYVQSARLGSDVVCLYRRGSAKHGPDGTLQLQRSCDGGRNWSEPVAAYDRTPRTPPESVINGALMSQGNELLAAVASLDMVNPNVYVFGEEAAAFPHYTGLCRSADGGRTWDEPVRVDTSPYGGARVGIATNPYRLADGALCLPLEVCLDCGPQATAAVVSRDGGCTFSPPQLLVGDLSGALSLCDARLTRLSDGTYLMHLWTFEYKGERTLHVHQSRSTYGLVWSSPEPTNIRGQISHPLEVEPGLLIAVCNHREPPEGNQLWWSFDQGRTWCEAPVHLWDVAADRVLGQPAAQAGEACRQEVWNALPKFAFGTPSLQVLEDGSVLLLYWATIGGVIHIRACRFKLHP